MTYISECKAPDLTDLRYSMLGAYAWNRVVAGCGTSDRTANSYVANYVVAVDKAVREYCDGRLTLLRYVSSDDDIPLLVEGLGRFETCINATRRALRFVDQLARHPGGPQVERDVRRLLDSQGKLITSVRDAVEHMDEWIQRDELVEGAPHMLSITRDAQLLVIGEHELSLGALARLLAHLHELAQELVRYKESGPSDV